MPRQLYSREAGWIPAAIWSDAENSSPLGFNPWTAQPIVSLYTDYTISANMLMISILKFWKIKLT